MGNAGYGPNSVAVDQKTDTIYVANFLSVSVINGSANRITNEIKLGHQLPFAVAEDPATDMIYTANARSNTTSGINGLTQKVIVTIKVGYYPDSIAVNPLIDRIYVVNEFDSSMSVIDGSKNKVIATIPLGGVSNPSVAVDPNNNLVYISCICNDLTVISGKNNSIIKTVSFGFTLQTGIAVDETRNLLYLDTCCNPEILIVDATTMSLMGTIQKASGYYSYRLGLDPATNLLYVLTNPSTGVISVIDPSKRSIVANISLGYPYYETESMIAVDSSTEKIYVTSAFDSSLITIDGSHNIVTKKIVLGREPTIPTVNPSTNMIYTVDAASDTVSVINGSTHKVVANVPVGFVPVGIAVDQKLNKIFV